MIIWIDFSRCDFDRTSSFSINSQISLVAESIGIWLLTSTFFASTETCSGSFLKVRLYVVASQLTMVMTRFSHLYGASFSFQFKRLTEK